MKLRPDYFMLSSENRNSHRLKTTRNSIQKRELSNCIVFINYQ